ncbi:MAG: hypothetical protein EP329_04035 [Deltaproteobacteria bacterium]|nr:MAG: hypothetical protein EP329_04035 [Deltaproteobacteria bacterium]
MCRSLLVSLCCSVAILSSVPPAHADTGYKKGFFIKAEEGDKAFALTLNGILHPRFVYTFRDGKDDAFDFEITRARLGFKGFILTKDLSYKFVADFGKGDALLVDGLVNYAFSSDVQLRVGQWKRPYSRQFMASATGLQQVDRAITDKAFGAGRDIGLAFHNDYERSPELEWVVGIFDGTGEKPHYDVETDINGLVIGVSRTNVPTRFRPVLAARVGYNHGDMAGEGYSESDLHPEKGLRFGVAASGVVDIGIDDDHGSISAEVDFILKASGFAASGAFFLRALTGDESGLDATGFMVQAGYAIGGKVEPSLRYARVMPEDDADKTLQEIALAISAYFAGHTFKWTTDVAGLGSEVGGTSTTDWRLRTQLQLNF